MDFARKAFVGSVTLSLKARADFSSLTLDTADLLVLCVSCDSQPVPFRLHALEPPFGRALEVYVAKKKGATFEVTVEYETTPASSGLQWLPPSLTEGKKLPYVFSQFQAIHARSFVPCQDSPGCKVTYSATIRVLNSVPLVVLMSALGTGKRVTDSHTAYSFQQVLGVVFC